MATAAQAETRDMFGNELESISDEALKRVRYFTMKRTVEILLDRRASEWSRRESWDWMIQGDPAHPFSFENCARQEGADPQTLRELIADEVRRKGMVPRTKEMMRQEVINELCQLAPEEPNWDALDYETAVDWLSRLRKLRSSQKKRSIPQETANDLF